MKKVCFLLLGLLLGIEVFGATYKVNTPILKVWGFPVVGMEYVGSLKQGDEICTNHKIEDGWLCFDSNQHWANTSDGSYGNFNYVEAKYLIKIDDKPYKPASRRSLEIFDLKEFVENIELPYISQGWLTAIMIISLFVASVLSATAEGNKVKLLCGLSFLIVHAVAELYGTFMNNGTLLVWFFDNGFIMFVVGLILLLGLVIAQIESLVLILFETNKNAGVTIEWQWGFLPWLLVAVAFGLDKFLDFDIANTTFTLFAIYQFVFCGYVVYKYLTSGNGLLSIWVVIAYLLGCTATIVSLSIFFVVLVVACIFCLLAYLGLGAAGASGSVKTTYSTSSGDNLRKIDNNTFLDDSGRRWKGDGYNVWRND